MSLERDNEKAEWASALKAAGHTPMLDEDGEIDMFVTDHGFHNGPGCAVCRRSWCEHCHDPESLPACTGSVT